MKKFARTVIAVAALFIIGGEAAQLDAQPYRHHHRRPHCVRYHHGHCVRWSR